MPNHEDNRPDPDALLAGLAREQRGGLKVFLGAALGVGKTYAMLLAAQEAHREGRDIVIGVIESHGRRETEALCESLESVPLLPVTYRDRTFREFNLDAVLERKPHIVLVDELAHRNIPGTRHPRRYQDIQEILAQGIDVWTTVNVQHVESLNDRVAKITGVRQRETVPDSLLEQARDIVLIDLTPRELMERLEHGKVYVPEQVRPALEGYFNPSNLTALREMAFAAASAHVDADLRQAMQRQGKQGPWPARDRVVVTIDGRSASEQVVRASKRLAERRHAPWTVVYVDTGRIRSPAAQQILDRATAVQRVAVETIASFELAPVCLLVAEGGGDTLEVAAAAPEPVTLDDKERAAAEWSFKHGQASGYQTETLTSIDWRFLPLKLDEACYGVLGVKLSELPHRASPEQLLLLDALANQVIFTLARTRLSSSLEQARVAEETERLRSSLLSSVSHDLRTPLSSMIGSASSLRELDSELSPGDKQELLDAVLTEG